jgi:hypothetical protein
MGELRYLCAQCGQRVRTKRGLRGDLQPAAHRNKEHNFYCSGQRLVEDTRARSGEHLSPTDTARD